VVINRGVKNYLCGDANDVNSINSWEDIRL